MFSSIEYLIDFREIPLGGDGRFTGLKMGRHIHLQSLLKILTPVYMLGGFALS
jgi:hypothetical protein